MKLELVERMNTGTTLIINDYYSYTATRDRPRPRVCKANQSKSACLLPSFLLTTLITCIEVQPESLYIFRPILSHVAIQCISLRLRGYVAPIIRILLVQAPSGLPHDKSFMSLGYAKREEILWAASKLR
eukprot:scaffold18896_cov82-Skeletonema_dohrnii-CCMP3373.AAC.1